MDGDGAALLQRLNPFLGPDRLRALHCALAFLMLHASRAAQAMRCLGLVRDLPAAPRGASSFLLKPLFSSTCLQHTHFGAHGGGRQCEDYLDLTFPQSRI